MQRCFNPHRPRKAGATLQHLYVRSENLVSILTGPERPALRCNICMCAARIWFQSSPAPKGRRYLAKFVCDLEGLLVSILTGPERPALPSLKVLISAFETFQSSPAPKGRRYFCKVWDTLKVGEFQSSPAPKGRRYDLPQQSSWFNCVSILTGPERPALPTPIICCFLLLAVSILTGPERPALLYRSLSRATIWYQFQSSPAPKGRRYTY